MSKNSNQAQATGNTVGKVGSVSAGWDHLGKRGDGPAKNLLEVRDLKVSYGGIQAVRGISFDVPEHEIVTLIGANGAGKSSTLRAIVALEKASGGSIRFEGNELVGMGTEQIVKNGITLVPEGRRVFVNLSVYENLRMGAYLRDDDIQQDLDWVYTLFPRLKERHWQAVVTLSGG